MEIFLINKNNLLKISESNLKTGEVLTKNKGLLQIIRDFEGETINPDLRMGFLKSEYSLFLNSKLLS